MSASREADRSEIERFVGTLFRFADQDTYASLRAFDQFRHDVPPEIIWPVKINGDLAPLIEQAFQAASRCAAADHSIVFAPPICTFDNPDRARGVDLANGLALSVELDEGDTQTHYEKLAVTQRQIALPTRPTKPSDSLAKNWAGDSVELDAIPPDFLRRLVRDAIERHITPARLAVIEPAEASERNAAEIFIRRINGDAA